MLLIEFSANCTITRPALHIYNKPFVPALKHSKYMISLQLYVSDHSLLQQKSSTPENSKDSLCCQELGSKCGVDFSWSFRNSRSDIHLHTLKPAAEASHSVLICRRSPFDSGTKEAGRSGQGIGNLPIGFDLRAEETAESAAESKQLQSWRT